MLNGYLVRTEMTKFLVSLREDGYHFCSGCLVSHKYVLTTAQCIQKVMRFAKKDFVRDIIAFVNGRNYDISQMKSHPNFNPRKATQTSNYDLGLITVGF